MKEKVRVTDIKVKKGRGSLALVTCYDATFARLVDRSGVDAVLVGDSLGTVVQGHESTLPVTMDEMVYHCRCVSRGIERAHLVGDLPFLSYQVSVEEAVRNAGRLIKEGRAESVKLEGGRRSENVVRRLVEIGIPVMGHVGLTPQSYHDFGGHKVQGRDRAGRASILEDAIVLEQAGAYALVLEGLPADLAQEITDKLSIPTIGIGAGPHCDGQVLVLYDLLGLDERFKAKFLKKYADLSGQVVTALEQYVTEVKQGTFPGREHSYQGGEK